MKTATKKLYFAVESQPQNDTAPVTLSLEATCPDSAIREVEQAVEARIDHEWFDGARSDLDDLLNFDLTSISEVTDQFLEAIGGRRLDTQSGWDTWEIPADADERLAELRIVEIHDGSHIPKHLADRPFEEIVDELLTLDWRDMDGITRTLTTAALADGMVDGAICARAVPPRGWPGEIDSVMLTDQ